MPTPALDPRHRPRSFRVNARALLLVSALAGAATACSSPDAGTGGGSAAGSGGGPGASSASLQSSASSSGGGASGAGAGGTAPTNGPQLLAFGADVSTITAGGHVTFTAQLADPDGVGDIAGGSLVDDLGAYGSFVGTAQPGTYQLSLSWAQINQARSIRFPSGATIERSFTARFFDHENHGAERSLTLTLTCHGLAACNGACVDPLQSPDACATCDPPCAGGDACYLGACAALSACQGTSTSCQLACAASGMTCANQCDGGRGGSAYPYAGCGGEPHAVLCGDPILAAGASQCCCF